MCSNLPNTTCLWWLRPLAIKISTMGKFCKCTLNIINNRQIDRQMFVPWLLQPPANQGQEVITWDNLNQAAHVFMWAAAPSWQQTNDASGPTNCAREILMINLVITPLLGTNCMWVVFPVNHTKHWVKLSRLSELSSIINDSQTWRCVHTPPGWSRQQRLVLQGASLSPSHLW